MGREIAFSVAFWVGAVVIYALFSVFAFRLGKFSRMPGEGRTWAWTLPLFLGIAAALGVAAPFALHLLGTTSLFLVGLLLFAVAIGYARLTANWRARRLAQALAKRSPEVVAEFEHRRAFIRSRLGRWLYVATWAVIFVWSLVMAFAGLPPIE